MIHLLTIIICWKVLFSPDYRVAFDSSIALAKSIGISDDQILKNKQEIDDYFLR